MEQNTNALDTEITQDDIKMKEIGEETKKLEKDLKGAKRDIASSQKELLQAEQTVKQVMKEKEGMIPEKLKLKEQLSFKRKKIEKVTGQLEESEKELDAKLAIVSTKENEAKQVSAELDEFNGN